MFFLLRTLFTVVAHLPVAQAIVANGLDDQRCEFTGEFPDYIKEPAVALPKSPAMRPS
jgi:hypothetical protein